MGVGLVGLAPLPGRGGELMNDIGRIQGWGATMVVSLTTLEEMTDKGVVELGQTLEGKGVKWRHFPVADFGAPSAVVAERWTLISGEARATLKSGGNVLFHCHGGCGRSGMAVLRVMVEAGLPASDALSALRAVRPCAIETDAQMEWAIASHGSYGDLGK